MYHFFQIVTTSGYVISTRFFSDNDEIIVTLSSSHLVFLNQGTVLHSLPFCIAPHCPCSLILGWITKTFFLCTFFIHFSVTSHTYITRRMLPEISHYRWKGLTTRFSSSKLTWSCNQTFSFKNSSFTWLRFPNQVLKLILGSSPVN